MSEFAEEEAIDRELDRILETYDDLFLAGKFDEADEILRKVNVGDLHVDLIVGVLSFTVVAKDKLPSRARFVADAEAELRSRVPADQIEGLMGGLR